MVGRGRYFYQDTVESALLGPAYGVLLMGCFHQTSTVGNWTYLADYNNQVLHVSSHLACFYGGNWILGVSDLVVATTELIHYRREAHQQ